jgi:hypothetical protein
LKVDAQIHITALGRGYGRGRRIEAKWIGGRIAPIMRDLSALRVYKHSPNLIERLDAVTFTLAGGRLYLVDEDEQAFYVAQSERWAACYRLQRRTLRAIVSTVRYRWPRLFAWLHSRLLKPRLKPVS